MNKVIRIIQNYLLIALPFVIGSMVWSTFHPEGHVSSDATSLTKILWEVFSWNLIIWFAVLTLYLIALVTVQEVREGTVKRLANIKERDEREQYITGKAARAA